MAKRKNLLLTEATTMRMMGLAGIGSLANPFLKEQNEAKEDSHLEEEMDSMDELDETYEGMDELDETYEEMNELEDDEGEDFSFEDDEEDDFGFDEEDEEEDESLEEASSKACESCGMKEGKHKKGCSHEKLNENINKRLRKLKALLEQVEDSEPAPAPETPPAMEGSDDETEAKIKDFVKKLGGLVQDTLGVQVSVEEEDEEAMETPPDMAETPPEPVAEALNRLVDKVAARVRARLIEAKKKDPKAAAKAKLMKEKQAAAKKKEEEKKKKEMEAKKKKAEMKKKK